MDIVARMPLLVRGQPKRNNGLRDILVAKDVPWEIPEISLSEMEVAFTTREKAIRVRDGMIGPMTQYRMERYASEFVLREFEGELYTKVADAKTDLRPMFFTAFPVSWEQHYQGEDYDISFDSRSSEDRMRREQAISQISYAVYKQLTWHQSCLWVHDLDPTYTWPVQTSAPRDAPYGINGRNYATFEDQLSKIVDFDKNQYDACMEMYPLQLSRLILADGQLWMKTPPPVYRVRPQYEAQKTSAMISICLAPDRHDMKVSNAIFSLAARDEALDYAQRFADASQKERGRKDDPKRERGDVHDNTVEYEVSDDRLIAYDHQTEEVRRFSCAMAAENRRFVSRNPEWAEKHGFSAEDVRGVHQSFEQVLATNYITGQFGDASPWLERNFAMWRRAGRKQSAYQIGNTHATDLLMERAMRYDENRPIHIGVSSLAPKPISGF